MNPSFSFDAGIPSEELGRLKNEWLETLTSPQDGMWESFRSYATHYGIRQAGEWVGYTNVADDGKLLQFYIAPRFMNRGNDVFRQLIGQRQISSAMVGTNNPGFMTYALKYAQTVDIHTYLFRDHFHQTIPDQEGELKQCQGEDLGRIVDFCHDSMGAPKEWLMGYIGGLIERGEIFVFEQNDQVVGTCEVRQSLSAEQYTDIGMVVSPDFRKQGFGTYLLCQAMRISKERGKIPICSTEKDNIGSLKAIHNCGFYSQYQLLGVTF